MKKINIHTLSLQNALTAMALTGIGLALPRLANAYGFALWQQGLLVSLQFTGFTLSVLLGGVLCERYGQRLLLTFALAGALIAMTLFGSAASYGVVLAAVLCVGISASIMQNVTMVLAMGLDAKKRTVNNSILQAAFAVGAIVIPLVFWLSIDVLGSWRWAYYFIALAALALLIQMLLRRPRSNPHPVSWRQTFSQYLILFRDPRYLIAPITLFLYVGAEIGLWAFAPLFFEAKGFGILSGILSSILIWVMMLIGRIIVTGMVRRLRSIPIMLVFAVMAMLLLGSLFFATGWWPIIIAGLSGFACAPFYPLILTWMVDITGRQTNTIIAATMAFGSFGGVVMSILTGVLAQTLGSQYIMLLPAIAFLLVFFMLIIFRRVKVQPQDNGEA